MGDPKGEGWEKGAENLFKGIMAEHLPYLGGYRNSDTWLSKIPKLVELKEDFTKAQYNQAVKNQR